jgi:hypothetical protein
MMPVTPAIDIQSAFQQVCELYDSLYRAFQQLGAQHQQALSHVSTDAARAKMNMSFNMQYLQLQQKMQDESRRFTLLSNIMKTRHDTAKNSISNVR